MSPRKEPCFFIAEYMRQQLELGLGSADEVRAYEDQGRFRTREKYATLFENATSERWVGEASHYIYAPDVRGIIDGMSPNARILVAFRDPVDRLVSEYGRLVREEKTTETLDEFALRDATVSDGRITGFGKTSKLRRGLQAQLVQPWIETFGADRVKFLFFEDLETDPMGVSADIYSWLEVDSSFKPTVVHTQKGGHVRAPGLVRALNNSRKPARLIKGLLPKMLKEQIRSKIYKGAVERPKLSGELEELLRAFYLPDIIALQELTNRDLSHWQRSTVTQGLRQ